MSVTHPPAPRLCVLVPSLGGDDEVAWAQQQVVAALATSADVHVIFLGATDAPAFAGASVTRHPLGPGLTTAAVLRRDLLVANFSVPTVGYSFPRPSPSHPAEVFDVLLPHDTSASWESAGKLLESLQPDAVVVFDHRDTEIVVALESIVDTPVFLVPLVDAAATSDRVHYDRLFERVDGMIALTPAEQRTLQTRTNAPIVRVDLPVDVGATSPVQAGANDQDNPYVLILLTTSSRDRFGLAPFADLVGLANPAIDVVIVSHDGTVCWRGGHRQVRSPVTTDEDVRRHMAGAAVVVDLHPGRLVARRCIEALRLGTPLVVPSGSRAKSLCDDAEGGLSFSNASELLWAVDTLLDPARGRIAGEKGRAYCDEHHGSPARLAEQLLSALGLPG